MNLSVIVPCYNEEETVVEALRRLIKTSCIDEVVMVDDGSTDNSLQEAEAYHGRLRSNRDKLRITSMPDNKGKGAAVRKGLALATGEVIAICDADLEYSPSDLCPMLEIIRRDRADVVYGSRFLAGERLAGSYINYMGNKVLTAFTNILYNIRLTDMETCFKMFKRDVADSIELSSDSFSIEPEITAKIIKKGWRIYEIPICYSPRGRESGKKIHWYHGFSALWTLIMCRFSK